MLLALVAALSLLVGFLIGVVFDDALDLYRASRKEPPMPQNSSAVRRVLFIGLAISLVLNVAVGVLVGVTLTQRSAYTKCVATWAQDFSSGYKARYNASVDVSTAMDAIVEAVGGQDPAAFKKAVAGYRDLRQTQKEKQKSNPLPPLPETLCGKPLGVS